MGFCFTVLRFLPPREQKCGQRKRRSEKWRCPDFKTSARGTKKGQRRHRSADLYRNQINLETEAGALLLLSPGVCVCFSRWAWSAWVLSFISWM